MRSPVLLAACATLLYRCCSWHCGGRPTPIQRTLTPSRRLRARKEKFPYADSHRREGPRCAQPATGNSTTLRASFSDGHRHELKISWHACRGTRAAFAGPFARASRGPRPPPSNRRGSSQHSWETSSEQAPRHGGCAELRRSHFPARDRRAHPRRRPPVCFARKVAWRSAPASAPIRICASA